MSAFFQKGTALFNRARRRGRPAFAHEGHPLPAPGNGPRAIVARALRAAVAATVLFPGTNPWPSPAAWAADTQAPKAAGQAAQADPNASALLYFFSPDWRPPDLGRLTVAVEDALRAGDVHVSFQAFTRYEDFERQVLEQAPDFLIAPAWLDDAGAISPGLSLVVVAQPLRHGKSTYRKALMTRPGIDSMDDLARGSIAATVHSMSGGSPGAVLDAFHLAVDSAKVVPVPKDVDALLALSFGQVDAALVTSEQYEQLARTRPAEADRLRVLAFSPEVRLPPVFASRSADPALRERLRDQLVRLAELPRGSEVLEMLGFDRFVAVTPPGPDEMPAPGGIQVATPTPDANIKPPPEPAPAAPSRRRGGKAAAETRSPRGTRRH